MNYQQIQKYLKDQVLNIEIDTQNDNQEKITGLKTEFLTAKNLTKNQELTEVLTRFYDSVINTITPDEKYYQLPVVEQLTANYFATKKPNLGIKSNDGIEQAIADQHYKLLDKILANWQATLPRETPQDAPEENPEEIPLTANTLQDQAVALQEQVKELLKSKTDTNPDTNLMAEMMRLFGTELTQARSQSNQPRFWEIITKQKKSGLSAFI